MSEFSEADIRQIVQVVVSELGERTWYTPPQIAKQLGVRVSKVVGWIERGELVGVNLADRPNGRPRWKVAAEELKKFLERRQAVPPPPPAVRVKRKRDFKIFFE